MFFSFKIHYFPFHMFMNSTSKIHFTYFTGFRKFKLLCTTLEIITPHAQRERGKVIDRGVHIGIYIYVCSQKKNLNRTLEIDSPFQTLTVGLLVEFID